MNLTPPAPKRTFERFHTKLLIAMMLVVTGATTVSVILAQRNVAATVKQELDRQFRGELATFHAVQAMRHAALAERCRALARKPRIHAALEDNALDLLYPSAREELRDIRELGPTEFADSATHYFHARFYRFIDSRGAVIPTTELQEVGPLSPPEESELALSAAPTKTQTGYLLRNAGTADETVDEVITIPILSTENGAAIAALALGFNRIDLSGQPAESSTLSGIWVKGHLHLPASTEGVRKMLTEKITRELAGPADGEDNFMAEIDGAPCLVFYLPLNPTSSYPAAYEVRVFPLTRSLAQQRLLFWQFAGAGGLLLVGAFIASHFLSIQLARPVEKLAVESEATQTKLVRAESALEMTHEELQRSARFSADASHQLKTPVTVLRAGLEELLAGETLTPEVRGEVSTLVHQTFRLTSVIEDLLLLSRMDAGRLALDFSAVNLNQLIEGWLDDLSALPDPLELKVESELPPALVVKGERRFTTLILQNLLENAQKYNRRDGRIRITARVEGPWAILGIGNTGHTIPAAAREYIFQRFHRGVMGENLPGHGLGLNLARELTRLHGGDLLLLDSASDWTEFEVRFLVADREIGATTGPT